jgi:hypothetical protein
VTPSDFELGGRFHARRLRTVEPLEPTTEEENVSVVRDERRSGAPGRLEPGATYDDIEIEKRLRAQTPPPRGE